MERVARSFVERKSLNDGERFSGGLSVNGMKVMISSSRFICFASTHVKLDSRRHGYRSLLCPVNVMNSTAHGWALYSLVVPRAPLTGRALGFAAA